MATTTQSLGYVFAQGADVSAFAAGHTQTQKWCIALQLHVQQLQVMDHHVARLADEARRATASTESSALLANDRGAAALLPAPVGRDVAAHATVAAASPLATSAHLSLRALSLLGLLVALAGFIVWLAGINGGLTKSYDIFFQQSVEGLSQGGFGGLITSGRGLLGLLRLERPTTGGEPLLQVDAAKTHLFDGQSEQRL